MAERMINATVAKRFVLAATIAAGFAALATLAFIFTGTLGFGLWQLVDVVSFVALAFGIYKRSRVCALLLFTLHLINRVDMWTRTQDIATSFGGVAIIFAVIYFLGILGTFAHHAIKVQGRMGDGS